MKSLAGTTSIVTGGAGGLGTVVSRRLLEEGSSVWIFGRSPDIESRISPDPRGAMQYLQVDVTNEKHVEHAFHTVMNRSLRIDLVVNAVGGYLPGKPICDVSEAEWDSMMNVNLKSSFLCTREAARRMKSTGGGRIVNISALASMRPSLNRAPYSISKSGVNLLTELAAQELKGSGISVFAIAPSIIVTDANVKSMPNDDQRGWVKPEEISDLIVFLCSGHGANLSGTVFKMGG